MDSFLEWVTRHLLYLEEIRVRMVRLAVTFGIFFLVGAFYSGSIIRFFISVFHFENVSVIATSPFQIINLAVDVGLFLASCAIVPFFIYHLFSFIAPAITRAEKKLFLFLLPASIVLFVLGFGYGLLILYYSFGIFSNLNAHFGIVNMWDVSTFFAQASTVSLILGVLFQFPILLTILIRLGLMKVDFLRRKRKIAYLIILAVCSLLPPPDVLSLVWESAPLLLLYEWSILINLKTTHYVWTRN